MATIYKIHPAIGTARIGNSAEYYLAPEAPGALPLDPNSGKPIYAGGGPGVPAQNIFHDASGALKKQAARFKVYAYDNANPADLGTRVAVGTTKIGGKTVTGIEWTVYLANKKASWFQFQELTGSGLAGDAGYLANNAANPGGNNQSLPYNPLRSNVLFGLSDDPATIDDPKRRQLILDPGPRTVSGPNANPQEFNVAAKGLQPFEITTLGRILTDGESNLIVLGGNGSSGTTDRPIQLSVSPNDYANNSGWFDDISDGPVSGALVLEDGTKLPIDVAAWVLCGPPKYAPEIVNIVTMYDTMYDIFVRLFGLNPSLYQNGQFQSSYQPNHDAEVTPILKRPNLYRYVAAIGSVGIGNHARLPTYTSQQFAQIVEGVLRNPADTNADKNEDGLPLMPRVAGDNPLSDFQRSNFLTLTATQYFILSQWAKGVFASGSPPAKGEGMALDQATLQNCVGGAFCPGIEMTWICRNTTIYRPLPANPSLSDAFRIRHKDVSGGVTLTNGANNDYSAGLEPGDISKYMAQPWQADFNECSMEPIGTDNPTPNYWWWPAQRPYSVFPAAAPTQQRAWTRIDPDDPNLDGGFPDLQMATNWKDVGFILNVGGAAAGSASFVEIERNQEAISDYSPPAVA
jgi:hypothetical protein